MILGTDSSSFSLNELLYEGHEGHVASRCNLPALLDRDRLLGTGLPVQGRRRLTAFDRELAGAWCFLVVVVAPLRLTRSLTRKGRVVMTRLPRRRVS